MNRRKALLLKKLPPLRKDLPTQQKSPPMPKTYNPNVFGLVRIEGR